MAFLIIKKKKERREAGRGHTLGQPNIVSEVEHRQPGGQLSGGLEVTPPSHSQVDELLKER